MFILQADHAQSPEVFLASIEASLPLVWWHRVEGVSVPGSLSAGIHAMVFCAHRERKENLGKRVTQESR